MRTEGGIADLLVGELVAERYRIVRVLGHGGMGAVYAAEDVALSEHVALKVLTAPTIDGSLELFRREVRLARRVTHPNVVRTYDLGRARGFHFLTMELIEGASLKEHLASAPLPRHETIVLLRQIAAGLTAAHEVGVVHRDLKPSNVLVSPNGRVAITDFGIARSLGEDPGELTQSGLLLGTPAYMAPEQLLGEVPGPAADLYALGLMAYEMATGMRLHGSGASLRTRLEAGPVDPRALVHLPPALSALVLACLAFEVARRPPGARDVLRQLTDLEAEGVAVAFGATEPRGPGRLVDDAVTVQERPSAFARFAPMPATRHTVAVLPFQATETDAWLAEALAEALSDRLCRTDGFAVFGLAATRAMTRDARRIGAELGADLVVEGTLARTESTTRTTVRLVDTSTGAQVWAERFDGGLADALDVQDRVATTIAEHLRVELALRAREFHLDARDVADYLEARVPGAARGLVDSESLRRSADALGRLVARVPGFDLAIAARADVLARLSFAGLDAVTLPEVDEAVDQALRVAPWLPETQLAAARRSVARGEFAEAAGALARATHMAPTFAAAQAYLGSLQVEAGRADEGVERIERAMRIDPGERWALVAVAKHHGLRRDYARSESVLDALVDADPRHEASCLAVRLRQAIWRDAKDRTPELESAIQRFATERPLLVTLFETWLGAAPPESMERLAERLSSRATPRAQSLHAQLLVEMSVRAGRHRAAVQHLEAVASTVLIDLEWLSYCEALDPIRGLIPATVRESVKRRAMHIWRP